MEYIDTERQYRCGSCIYFAFLSNKSGIKPDYAISERKIVKIIIE